jgi:hypothetical protein
VIDIIDRTLASTEVEEVLDDFDIIPGPEDFLFERCFLAELDIELEPADPAEVVLLGIEEEVPE